MSAGTQFDTNVTRQSSGEEADVSFRLTPRIAADSQEGRWSYRLQYAPTFQKFVTKGDEDSLTHYASGEAGYALTNKTSLLVSDRFSVRQELNVDTTEGANTDLTLGQDTELGREQVITNEGTVALSHIFTPRWVGRFVVAHNLFEPERTDRVDSSSVALLGSGTYLYDGSNTFGFGARAIFQQYDDVQDDRTALAPPPGGTGCPQVVPGRLEQPESNTNIFGLFASWERRFGEATSFQVNGGPALISTTQEFDTIAIVLSETGNFAGCRVDHQDESDLRITYLGRAVLEHSWSDRLRSSLAYERSATNSSGIGASVLTDRVSFVTSWLPSPRWDFSLRGDWQQRESSTELSQVVATGGQTAAANASVDTTRWAVTGRAAYRLTQHLTATLNLLYSQQEISRSTVTTGAGTFDNFVGLLSLRYEFDPFRF